jgi:stage II sporulation protein P
MSIICFITAITAAVVTVKNESEGIKLGALEFVMRDVFKIKGQAESQSLYEIMTRSYFSGDIPAAQNIYIPSDNTSIDNSTVINPSVPTNSIAEPPIVNSPEMTPTREELLESLYSFDLSLVPEGEFPIVPMDLTKESDGILKLSNETEYNPDVNALLQTEPAVPVFASSAAGEDAPLVLIIHTHGTEAYSAEDSISYSPDTNVPRSEDTNLNVVAVGDVMARVFEENEISVIHCRIMFDQESYIESYARAAETIEYYLNMYPSIKYVFDVHRDSLITTDKSKIRPVTIVNGEPAAQYMTVVGSDAKGGDHPNWMTNLTLAAKLQESLNNDYAGLARSIYLRGATFNEQFAEGSLLLEVGSCGNTLSEAKKTGEIVAQELAELINKGW